jgi:predicted PurR-regulated permease PerM
MTDRRPFYIRATVILLGLTLFVYALSTLREILVPLAFSLLLAILLNPLDGRFRKWGIPRVWSISLSVILGIVVVGGIIFFLVTQMRVFSKDLPKLEKRFTEISQQLQQTVDQKLGFEKESQDKFLKETQEKLKPMIGKTLGTVAGALGVALLIPVYVFLILFYKTLLLDFLHDLLRKNSMDVSEVLHETKGAVQSYMIGLMMEAAIIATLNSVALLIIGVKYAILLGVIGALLNVLPYIGGIVSTILPMGMAMMTQEGVAPPLLVLGAYLVIQFADNHFIMPYVVSSKVNLNALISIVIVLMGGALWGVPGMFLSIPFTGVLKIIFDRVPDLQPWGKLLGDQVPTRDGSPWSMKKHPKKKD